MDGSPLRWPMIEAAITVPACLTYQEAGQQQQQAERCPRSAHKKKIACKKRAIILTISTRGYSRDSLREEKMFWTKRNECIRVCQANHRRAPSRARRAQQVTFNVHMTQDPATKKLTLASHRSYSTRVWLYRGPTRSPRRMPASLPTRPHPLRLSFYLPPRSLEIFSKCFASQP